MFGQNMSGMKNPMKQSPTNLKRITDVLFSKNLEVHLDEKKDTISSGCLTFEGGIDAIGIVSVFKDNKQIISINMNNEESSNIIEMLLQTYLEKKIK